MKRFYGLLAACGAMAVARVLHADSDVVPLVQNGRIITNGHDDATGEDITNVRVFGYTFNKPADPYFVQDPGFNAPAGSGLPASSQLRFNVLSSLYYWNGQDAVVWGAPPNAEGIKLNFGASNVTISGSSSAQAGFSVGLISSNGSFHRHLNAFLLGADGNAVAGDGVEATPGIYYFSIECAGSDTNIAASEPVYLVYRSGVGPAPHDLARINLRDTFAPGSKLPGLTEPPQWGVDDSGDWSDASRWIGGVPNSLGAEANFLGKITAPRRVNVNIPVILGSLSFENAHSYQVTNGGGSITFDAASTARIDVTTGRHSVQAPIALSADTDISIAAGAGLDLTGVIFISAGRTLHLQTGEMSAGSMAGEGGVRLAGGTRLNLASGAPASRLRSLELAGIPGDWQSTFDLADGAVVIEADAATRSAALAMLTDQIGSSRNGPAGAWLGAGITSSAAAANPLTGLAILLNSELGAAIHSPTFEGIAVDEDSILIKWTWNGDADLSGAIDADDYFRIDSGFAAGATAYQYGDFDYSGSVDADDYFLIDSAFASQTGPLGRSGLILIPEPSLLPLLAIGIGLCGIRVRKGVGHKHL